MIRYFISSPGEKKIREIEAPCKDCWIHLEAPSNEEIYQISSLTGIPEDFMKSAMDEEEVAHLSVENDTKMIVIDIPKTLNSKPVLTMPLALIQTDNYLVSVCSVPTTVLNDFIEGKIKNIDTASRSKFIYQIILNNSVRFLFYLRQIDKASDLIQKGLAESMKNKELLQLLELQKSLVFFSASLTANNAVIQRIANNVNMSKVSDEERDILEDVVIETKQALEMCSVYREIIKSTMDAFASVVNNNQNIIMKFLTAITIILTIPMVIAGFWGMNSAVPLEGNIMGFWIIIGASLLLSAVVSIIMAKKKMF